MLNLSECTSTEWLNHPTKFKLFECDDFIRSSDLIRKAHHQATSCSSKKLPVNNNADENDGDSSTADTAKRLSLLLAYHALEQAVSQVELQMDGWELSYIFKLFIVLVHPLPDTDLDAIKGLPCYLTQSLVEIRSLANNGTREIVCHCWCALQSKHLTPSLLQL
jgi:hypothetical protein